MQEQSEDRQAIDLAGPNSPHFRLDETASTLDENGALLESSVAGWEEVEAGRFMPRRVRGSCVGRALG